MILSIESSCDDTSVAVTNLYNKKIVFYDRVSQAKEHLKYGGVFPELASRLHVEILPVLLHKVKPYFRHLKAVAVTTTPGLDISLLQGVSVANSLSVCLGIPIISVNHLMGHIYSLFIGKDEILPQVVLIISGGHTQIVKISSYNRIHILADTLDDSFGESFDKVARMLGFSYPGGPEIEKYALMGDDSRFSFTVPLVKNKVKNSFSYSGLKNQVRLAIQKIEKINKKDKLDISASFQKIAVKHISNVVESILKESPVKLFSVVGGASSNLYLRGKLCLLCKKFGISLGTSDIKYCLDNAAMIGRYAIEKYKRGEFSKIAKIGIDT